MSSTYIIEVGFLSREDDCKQLTICLFSLNLL